MKSRILKVLCGVLIWTALIGGAAAQSIGNAPVLSPPLQPTDKLFIFRGNTPVNAATVATLLSGLTTGVFGPATSTNGFVPTWNGVAGNALAAGLPVGQTGNSTIVETDSAGLISTAILPSTVSLLGNLVTGNGHVVLQISPTLTTPTLNSATLATPTLTSATLTNPAIGFAGATFAGSSSGQATLVAAATAGGSITIPNRTGTMVTTGDTATVSNAMLVHPNTTVAGVSCVLGSSCAIAASNLSNGTTGSGPIVLAGSPVLSSPIISNGTLRYTTLPTGTPTSYACFDGMGNLISFWAPCR